MYVFGGRSKQVLSQAHPDLQKIFNLAITRTSVDMSVYESYRSIEDQRKYFQTGRSKLNPDNPDHLKNAKHLRNPAEAIDFCAYVPGKDLSYDANHLSVLWGVLDSCAKELLEKGEINHRLRWGGNWDMDGTVIHDQGFDDLCHVELINL